MTDVKTLQITSLGAHGEGIGSIDRIKVFVPGALPEEVVEAQVTTEKKNYKKALLKKILKPSPYRTAPSCILFPKCGGCQLMHLSYEKQLYVKRQKIIDALERIAKLQNPPVKKITPAPTPWAYRNKIHLPIRQKNGKLLMGLYERNSHNLIDVPACLIHNSLGERVAKELRSLLKKHNIQGYIEEDHRKTNERLRSILIRTALSTGQLLVVFVTESSPSDTLKKLAFELIQMEIGVESVYHNKGAKVGNALFGKTFTLLAGQDFIIEKLGNLSFKVSQDSFFQVYPDQALLLYQKAVELASLKGDEVVIDCHCGVGTLSLFFAKHVQKVLGVEVVENAVYNAKENARLNTISNTFFRKGRIETIYPSLEKEDLLLLNPPRKGCEEKLLHSISKKLPKTILYISCDPATLARDVQILLQLGYTLDVLHPFDMFPQTFHVESLAKLTLKNERVKNETTQVVIEK